MLAGCKLLLADDSVTIQKVVDLTFADEGVEVVAFGNGRAAIDNIEQVQGAVLSRKMKAALIRDFLEVWIKYKGGSWQQIEGRPGERAHEYLIGEPELPYTSELEFDGVPHFLIKFNELVAKPLADPFCSADAPRLTEAEMLDIIDHPPPEEL